jgi:hypothetical protein
VCSRVPGICVGAATEGIRDIEECNIRGVLANRRERCVAIDTLGDDLDFRIGPEQTHQPIPAQRRIVGHEDPKSH